MERIRKASIPIFNLLDIHTKTTIPPITFKNHNSGYVPGYAPTQVYKFDYPKHRYSLIFSSNLN